MKPYNFTYGSVEKFNNHSKILHDIFSLRYQVYVNEWKFENAVDHPEGLENDEYDECSVHYYARCKSEGKVIGAARIILNSELGFPISKHFELNFQSKGIENNRIAEISRLAVSKEFRRRAIDNAIFGASNYNPGNIPRYMDEGRDPRRHCEHELIRGLYMSIYIDSKQRGLTHWYAVMAKGLYIILKRWGIIFDQVGPAKNYHGIRAPYLVCIESVEHALKKINPEMLEDARRLNLH